MAIDEVSQHSRRLNARTKAKSIGLDPDELDFEAAALQPTFSPSGFQKSVEITALIRLLEKRWAERNATTAKKARTRSTA